MQNRYVADIGDFGKYGLLGFIASKTNLRLGVNWCLTEEEKKSGDGKFIDYLLVDTKYKGKITKQYAQKIKDTDRELYDKLQKIIIDWCDKNRNLEFRCVKQIEDYKILPNETIFYDEKLFNNTDRTNWLSNGIKNLSECKIVFFDPDNGIDSKVEDKSPKHIYLDEIKAYYKNGQSLVIYQHANRNKKFNEVINEITTKLINELKIKKTQIICLRYKRGTARAFFIIMQQKDSDFITKATKEFLEKWGEHFCKI